jgi:sugar phosphate isomerase/epimerase
MKYSFMSFSCPELSLREFLSLAKRIGYDGVEPRVVSQHGHGIETETSATHRAAFKRLAEEMGVEYACVATSCRYANPASVAESIEETRRCLDLAADIGAARIRVFGGQIGQGLSRESAIALVADSLAVVAEHAKSRGVTVCMETHDDWCDPQHVAAVMARVNHPNIGVNWDVMHPVRTGAATMREAFETLKPWTRHLHIHDGEERSLKHTFIGEGAYDHRTAVACLLSVGYDGYLSGEWIGWEVPYEEYLPRELATMKAYESECSSRRDG